MKRWTDTEYVDTYQRYGTVPNAVVALADHEQALAEKDNVIIALQERIAYYDRWLSNGVYYTNDEFLERVLKPRQQLMEKAVRFAECLNDECKCTISEVNTDPACAYVRVREFLESPEVQKWRKEHPL